MELSKSMHMKDRKASEKSPLLSTKSMGGSCYWPQDKVPPGWGYRHLVVFLGFVGFCNVYALRANLSVAIVAMVNSTADALSSSGNVTIPGECPRDGTQEKSVQPGEFNWSPDMTGLILSAYFYGYMATEVIGAYMAERWGGKIVFGAGLFITALFTLFTAPAARISPYLLMAVRVIVGLGSGLTMPSMYTFLSKWSPPQERSMLVAFVLAGKNFGTVLAQPITGLLCEYGFDGGWPSVFYIFGGVGILSTIIWMVFVVDEPSEHPRISFTEKMYLVETTAMRGDRRPPTPWKYILTSGPVWALTVAHISHNWGYHTLFTTLPQYLADVLKFSVAMNGFITALPYLVRWVSENFAGWLADYVRQKRLLNTSAARKLFNSIGFVMAGVFIVIEGYVGCNQILGVVMITLSLGVLGVCAGGYQANHLDIAPLYAGTLMGITNTLATIPGLITPSLVSSITGGQPLISLWRYVFFMIAGVYVFGALVFALFGSGKEQKWAKGVISVSTNYTNQQKAESDSAEDDQGRQERLEQSLCLSLHE